MGFHGVADNTHRRSNADETSQQYSTLLYLTLLVHKVCYYDHLNIAAFLVRKISILGAPAPRFHALRDLVW